MIYIYIKETIKKESNFWHKLMKLLIKSKVPNYKYINKVQISKVITYMYKVLS